LPIMWIKRDILSSLTANRDPIQVLRGPRQCGKTSLALRIDPTFKELSLDDPALRELAENDPELFLSQFGGENLFIDEAQYAPRLFPSLKRRADLFKRQNPGERRTIIRLTGSNQIVMDRQIKESLAGRASFFDMNTLSVAEILAEKNTTIQDILFMGGWPELHAINDMNPKKYLDDYLNSYVEKDIVLAAGINKRREFIKFTSLLAGRVGTLLDLSGLANEVGVDSKTIKDWVSILETMHLIVLVQPFFTNLSNRLVKSPKIYFIDTGLACRLQGWGAPGPILTSPQQGHLFENLVFSEIFKMNINFQLGIKIFHWRSRDGEEIDFLLEFEPGKFLFVEAKVTARSVVDINELPQVKKIFKSGLPPIILCHQHGSEVLHKSVPISRLRDYLLKTMDQSRLTVR
jgi:predicted AAA+ superfamily ATPase